MFGKAREAIHYQQLYATSADFCRIFEKDMNRLYLLSFLLTGSHSAAEKCFVRGLDDSKSGNPVFKEWAESWARRTIVQNAIQMVQPRPTDILLSNCEHGDIIRQPAEIAAIIQLPNFDRFAYVLSVLEGYPLKECTLLLDCSRSELIAARMRALQEVVRSAEHHKSTKSVGSEPQIPQPNIDHDEFSRLAATA